MIFRSLEVRAFNRFRAPFTLPLEGQGVVLVEGENRDGPPGKSNASGKSLAAVEGLLWTGWGRMLRHGDRLVVAEAVHPTRGADATLRVDGWAAIRAKPPRGGATTFRVEAAGAPVPVSRDPSQKREDVEDLVGLDYATARAALVVGRGKAPALAESGFSAQMSTLEALLRMFELGQAQERAALRARALDGELTALTAARESQVQAVEAARLAVEELSAAPVTDTRALAAQVRAAASAVVKVEPARAALASATASVSAARQDLAKAEAKQRDVERDIERTRSAISRAVCPTCQRPYKTAEEVEELRRQETSLRFDYHKRGMSVDTARARVEKGQAAYDDAVEALASVERAAASHDALRAQLDQARAHTAQVAALVETARLRLVVAERAVEQTAALLAAQTVAAHRTRVWVSGFGRDGLQAELFAQAMPILNEAAASYGARLGVGAEFQPLRDRRTESLVRPIGASAPTYEGCSAGEKGALNLVTALSLRALARWRMPSPINLAIFDEAFDALDEPTVEAAAALVQEEATAPGATVYVITHRPEFKRWFPTARTMRVVREQNEATVLWS